LTEDEVLAIAEHEHIPEIAASALGQYLSRQERGIEQIRDSTTFGRHNRARINTTLWCCCMCYIIS
jgi:hypothetical protein